MKQIPLALTYDDVLLVPQYSEIDSRQEIDLRVRLAANLELAMPLVATKMDTVTGVEMAVEMGRLGGMAILPRFEAPEIQAEKVARVKKAGVITAAAVGCKNGFEERVRILVKAGATVINIDVAHGHMRQNLEATRRIKLMFGEKITLISGIAATGECAEDLYKAGADCVLVGIGAGSICTTRVMTGCGVPGFSSLLEVARVARKWKRTCLPDAGMRTSGDCVKALAAGASAICAGFLFAGSLETPGELVDIGGRKFKRYNGSASEGEKQKQVERYEADKEIHYVKHIEGVESVVEYRGPVKGVVQGLLAGIRSGMAYCGAKSVEVLWKKARFVRVTSSGIRESGAHDVTVMDCRPLG